MAECYHTATGVVLYEARHRAAKNGPRLFGGRNESCEKQPSSCLSSWGQPLEHETKPSSSSQKPNSPLGLLGILALSFGAWFLSKLSDPNHDSGSAQLPQPKPHNTTTIGPHIRPPFHVIVDASPPTPTPNKEREAREERQEGR